MSENTLQRGSESDPQGNLNQIVSFLFELQLINKQYHWNTTSFARHKATDEFGTTLATIMDHFVEVYIGRYNIKPQVDSVTLNKVQIGDETIIGLFNTTRDMLQSFETRMDIHDTDLLNIRDELLAAVNKTLYLFNLH